MRRRQPSPTPSSSDSHGSDTESCFDIGDEHEESEAETVLTDIVPDADKDDQADMAWTAGEENAFPPEYYLNQENNSDGSEDEDEDYSDGSLLLLRMIEGQFHRYISPCLSCSVNGSLT